LSNSFPAIADMDGDQPLAFYDIYPGYAVERHAGKSKFKGKLYYQYECKDSWTRPGNHAFVRVNGDLAFQGLQKSLVTLCLCATSFMLIKLELENKASTI